MSNAEINLNGGAYVVPANKKQPSAAIKKMALRDLQNQNGSFPGICQENSAIAGVKPTADATKVCGTKRLAPESPLSPPSHLSLGNSSVNEQILNARRRFELELGRGRMYSNMDKFGEFLQSRRSGQLQHENPQRQTYLRESSSPRIHVATSSNMTSPPPPSYSGAAFPNFLGKSGGMQATDLQNVSLDTVSKNTDEQHRTERFIRLQKFLKQCDESYQSDCIQMLLHLSPAELSRQAVELEKRSIQLTIEEGKEMQRMKAENILAKSAPSSSPLQTPQVYQSRN